MADINIGEIAATTLEMRSKETADNMLDNIALLNQIQKKGRVKPISGGNIIYEAIQYQDTSGFDWYSGWDPLATTQNPVVDVAQFAIKQAAVPVMMSGLEELQNAGEEQVIDLLDEKMDVAEKTMKNNMEVGLFSDGTGSGSKQINGLQLYVADTNTNTVGGISGNTYDWWRNISYDVSSSAYTTFTSATAQQIINAAYVQTVRGNEAPDCAFADNNYFVPFLESLQAMQRITTDSTGKLGFTSVFYMNMEVFLAGGRGGACPSSHMYLINTNYLKYRPHRRRNMVPLKKRDSFNQDGFVQYLSWAGALTITNRFVHAVIKA